MLFKLTKFIILKTLFIIFFSGNKVTSAEIIVGECPVIKSSPFDCSKIIDLFSNHTKSIASLQILAFLKTSTRLTKYSMFDYDFQDPELLSYFEVLIPCHNNESKYLDDWMVFYCSAIQHGPKLLLKPGLDNKLTLYTTEPDEQCPNISPVDDKFQLLTYMNANVVVFHGCEKINKTHMDRGLIVLKSSVKVLRNVNETLEETFKEMNLGHLSSFEGKLLINIDQANTENKSDASDKCSKHIYTKCKLTNLELAIQYFIKSEQKKANERTLNIIILIICILLILLVVLLVWFVVFWQMKISI